MLTYMWRAIARAVVGQLNARIGDVPSHYLSLGIAFLLKDSSLPHVLAIRPVGDPFGCQAVAVCENKGELDANCLDCGGVSPHGTSWHLTWHKVSLHVATEIV